MKHFGFIGFGRMAGMIIRALTLNAGTQPVDIFVTRKNLDRLPEIGEKFPAVNAVKTCREVAETAQVVFICVKPLEVKAVLAEIAPYVRNETHIVSLAGDVSLAHMDSVLSAKITKYMPTVTSLIETGVSLVCHNDRVTPDDAAYIEELIGLWSRVERIPDADFGFASELTSCMPGFIASLFGHFTEAALRHSSALDRDTVTEMITETLLATAKLLLRLDTPFESLVARVATKGGITQQGVDVLDAELPRVLDAVFERTANKRKTVREKVDEEFKGGCGK